MAITPKDFGMLTQMPDHHSFGGYCPMMNRSGAPQETPFKGLWFIGSQSETGPGVWMQIVSSRNVCKKIAKVTTSPGASVCCPANLNEFSRSLRLFSAPDVAADALVNPTIKSRVVARARARAIQSERVRANVDKCFLVFKAILLIQYVTDNELTNLERDVDSFQYIERARCDFVTNSDLRGLQICFATMKS